MNVDAVSCTYDAVDDRSPMHRVLRIPRLRWLLAFALVQLFAFAACRVGSEYQDDEANQARAAAPPAATVNAR